MISQFPVLVLVHPKMRKHNWSYTTVFIPNVPLLLNPFIFTFSKSERWFLFFKRKHCNISQRKLKTFIPKGFLCCLYFEWLKLFLFRILSNALHRHYLLIYSGQKIIFYGWNHPHVLILDDDVCIDGSKIKKNCSFTNCTVFLHLFSITSL